MTKDEFLALCEPLGYGWKAWLARELPCNERTVRRWASGEYVIRPLVGMRIKSVVKKKLRGINR